MNDNNKILLYVILGAIIFFIFIMPMLDSNLNKTEGLDNTDNIKKLDLNMCSQLCCNQTQWPVAHMPKNEKTKDFVGSNLSCNFGRGSGCLCVKKEDMNYLTDRGGNAGENICRDK
jgi:hypothetical protein